MKKQSYKVPLKAMFSVGSYSKLFADEYNRLHTNSFAVSQPYSEDAYKCRDRSIYQILIFYEEDSVSTEILDTQILEVKNLIIKTMSSILDESKVNLISDSKDESIQR